MILIEVIIDLIFNDLIEPVLFVDVNLGSGISKRITVFENDTAEELAEEFSRDHSKKTIYFFYLSLDLDANTKLKLTKLLQSQMNQLLTKIEEGDDDEN